MLRSVKKMFRSNYLFTLGVIICLAWILAAILAPLLAPYDPIVQDLTMRLKAPSAEHLFGTDNFGRVKYRDGVVKALLRAAGKEHLPQEVIYRRKSPYPKTYDPAYEQLVRGHMRNVLEDANAPIRELIDGEKVKKFMEQPSDYARPFYGQLMAGPQLLAYLLQVNYWLAHYKVRMLH